MLNEGKWRAKYSSCSTQLIIRHLSTTSTKIARVSFLLCQIYDLTSY